MKLTGNTILITGGCGGIGLELATQLSKLGNDILVTGRDPAKWARIQKDLPAAHFIQADISRTDDVDHLYRWVRERFPRLNVLINNAGVGHAFDLKRSHDPLALGEELQTNLLGPILMINRFLPHLLEQSEAAVLNVTSALAFVPLASAPIYSASKAGLRAYTRSLRRQLENTSVKVFELAPPATRTKMLEQFGAKAIDRLPVLTTADLVAHTLKAMAVDRFEICPGQARSIRLLSRLAPEFALRALSKPLRRD